jgi:hypothetical protein
MNIIMTIASHHISFQVWAKSTNKNNWMRIKSNPPIKPKYIHAEKSKHFLVFNNKARHDNWLIFKFNLISIGNSYCWQICHFPPRMTSRTGWGGQWTWCPRIYSTNNKLNQISEITCVICATPCVRQNYRKICTIQLVIYCIRFLSWCIYLNKYV